MHSAGTIGTLALDLEGTLISNAVSQFPRPGLHAFLDFCRGSFPRLLVYTAVEERIFRGVARQLVADGYAPAWFQSVPHLQCEGQYKDLRLIPGADVATSLLVDDLESFVHPDQRDCWVRIEPFNKPYPTTDRELERVISLLREHLK